MINLFPAYYLRPTQTAAARSDEGSNVGGENEGADAGDNADDDNGNDDDDTDDNTSGYHDAEAPNVYIEKSQDMRKVFLSEFSDDEVAEMWQVHSFMVFTSGCTWNAAQSPVVSDSESNRLVLHGPCVINPRQKSYYGAAPAPQRRSFEPFGPSASHKCHRWSRSCGITPMQTTIGRGFRYIYKRKTMTRPRWASSTGTKLGTRI